MLMVEIENDKPIGILAGTETWIATGMVMGAQE
jgi:hypothetical protein